MKKHKCKRCGLEWESELDHPRACPKCHTYYWDEPYKRKPKAR